MECTVCMFSYFKLHCYNKFMCLEFRARLLIVGDLVICLNYADIITLYMVVLGFCLLLQLCLELLF